LTVDALQSFPVGVIVERLPATSPWIDFVWRPVSVLTGVPAAAAWTQLGSEADRVTFYAGSASVDLYRTETANYLLNLRSGAPCLWVVLRQRQAEPPWEVLAVTADPAEGEAFSEAGSDLVETVPMPASLAEAIETFVAEHHVERAFFKRRRQGTREEGPR
jgi:hypothetical protein